MNTHEEFFKTHGEDIVTSSNLTVEDLYSAFKSRFMSEVHASRTEEINRGVFVTQNSELEDK